MPTFDAGATGLTPGVAIFDASGDVYAARTTAGITESPAGSGCYVVADPDPTLTLRLVWDATIDGVTYYASETLYAGRGVTPSTFDPATDTVAHVTLVDTTTTNTDMRGTDGAVTSLTGIATATDVQAATTAATTAGSKADAAKASADLANRTAPDNTSVAAIKAKTDNLPASPAAVGSAMTLTSAYDAAKTAASATNLAALKTVADNILRWFTNKRVVGASSIKLRNDTDTADLYTQTLSDDGTTATRGKAT